MSVATDQIIKELCVETGDPGYFTYDFVLGKVMDGIRDLSIFNMPTWYMTKVCLNDYNAICWPKSCVVPLAVVLRRNGKSLALDVNDDMIGALDSTNVIAENVLDDGIQDFFRQDGVGSWLPAFNWGLGEVYGLPSGYKSFGMVSHIKARRQSVVKGLPILPDDEFEFYFKSDGLHECPTFVPSECKEAIEYFALAKMFRVKNPNLSAENRELYRQEFYRLQRLYDGDTVDAWKRVMSSNLVSTPKT